MKKLAILFGLDYYPILGSLRYARADAESFAKSLKELYGFNDSEILLTISDAKSKSTVTRQDIEGKLNELLDSDEQITLLVVGYWGHSFLSDGVRFLCSSKTNRKNLKKTGIDFNVFLGKVAQIGAATTVLVLDCCQNDPARGSSEETMFSEGDSAGLANAARDVVASRQKKGWLDVKPTLAVLNSCSPGERAYEWEVEGHGVFTKFLLDAMKERGTVGDWADYIDDHIADASDITNGEQHPFYKLEGRGQARLIPKGAQTEGLARELKEAYRKNVELEEKLSAIGKKSTPLKETPNTAEFKSVNDTSDLTPQKNGVKCLIKKAVLWGAFVALCAAFVVAYAFSGKHIEIIDDFSQTEPGALATLKYNGAKFAFRYCPAGSFSMGSPEDEAGRNSDEDSHLETIEEGFWICETETTQKQWNAVGAVKDSECLFIGTNLPVESVSWTESDAFVQRLNDLKVAPFGWRFALPSEEQWEYACRAGTTGSTYGVPVDEAAWYDDNSGRRTHEVGTKKPNAWGIYDMLGNVWEWTSSKVGSSFVFRGGGWGSIGALSCRPAERIGNVPSSCGDILGFRGVLVPSQSE